MHLVDVGAQAHNLAHAYYRWAVPWYFLGTGTDTMGTFVVYIGTMILS